MKADITVGKKFTINTGDYSSIQPNLSITFKDIDDDKILEVHTLLETIVDGLFHLQMKMDGKTMGTLKSMGLGTFLSELEESDIRLGIKEAIDEMEKYL